MDHQHFGSPAEPGGADPQPRLNGHAGIAWIVIVFACAMVIVGNNLSPSEAEGDPSEDSIGVMIMTFQSQVLIGAAEFPRQRRGQIYQMNAKALNTGSVAQRQRFIVLAADLAGAAEARRQLEALDDLIVDAQARTEKTLLTEEQEQVQDILRLLYATDSEEPAINALNSTHSDLLVQELGWFGKLALVPPGTDDASRQVVISRATYAAVVFMIILVLGGLALLGGVITLIVLLVLVLQGNVRSGLRPGAAHHGIYAETFAVWLIVFFAMQIAAQVLSQSVPGAGMMPAFAAFFLSLVALMWPRIRGVNWTDTRRDIGLTFGRNPLAEPVFGVVGYIMALPMLAVGLLMTMVLIALHSWLFAGTEPPLSPVSGPAHPIVEQLAGASWWPVIQIMLVATVAAPIVEEIMFRGVLYRHLRGATDATMGSGSGARTAGGVAVLSIVISATINGFIFAVIHPQGLLAVPALMSLAYAFALIREWRGSIVPSIIVHAISNGLVMSLLMFMISSGAD